jgi:pimeloyl-ACP methyl ester carboxylesterase
VHLAIEHRTGRLVTRTLLNTRISPQRWDPVPMPPDEAAAKIAPVPLLIVHGDQDKYFPIQHALRLYEAAGQPKELWAEEGFGHAESAVSAELLDRIGAWVAAAVSVTTAPNVVA